MSWSSSGSVNPTDSTPGIASTASKILRCTVGTRSLLRVTGHVKIGVDQDGVPWIQTEILVQRSHQSAHSDERRGNQNGADRISAK